LIDQIYKPGDLSIMIFLRRSSRLLLLRMYPKNNQQRQQRTAGVYISCSYNLNIRYLA